jgi:hypothetical protein
MYDSLIITLVCESTAFHSRTLQSTHKQPLQHIPSTITNSSMYQHHITGKHHNINSGHVVIFVDENGVLKSSSLIQVFTATTMN